MRFTPPLINMESTTPAFVGMAVHYVMNEGRYKGECRPATIVKVWNKTEPYTAQLAVLVDGTNDIPSHQFTDAAGHAQSVVTLWKTSIVQDIDMKPGTYHANLAHE